MPGLLGVEKLAAIYMALTLTLTAIYYGDMDGSTLITIVGGRAVIALIMLILFILYQRRPCHATYQLRVVFQVALLAYWYPDIYHFASMLPNQDHLLATVEQTLVPGASTA